MSDPAASTHFPATPSQGMLTLDQERSAVVAACGKADNSDVIKAAKSNAWRVNLALTTAPILAVMSSLVK
jgi:hypothetical protein